MDILEEIVAHKRIEVADAKEILPERELHRIVEQLIANDEAEGMGRIAIFIEASPIEFP